MLRYDRNPDELENLPEWEADSLSLKMVPENSRVLDLGCATGYHGAFLKKEKHSRVTGVTREKDEAEKAAGRLDRVITGDLDMHETWEEIFRHGPFDVALMLSVLEHVKNPEYVLKQVSRVMSSKGFAVVAVPNIRHYSVFLKNLAGIRKQEKGILDKTHQHRFSEKSFKRLLEQAGYTVIKTEYALCDIHLLPGKRVSAGGLLKRIPWVGRELEKSWKKIFRQLLTEQVIVKARPKNQ